MSNVQEIVAKLPNLEEYSRRLAENEVCLLPSNAATQVLFAVACHILPAKICKLTYEEFGAFKPDETPKSVQKKGGLAVNRYQRTFMEKWRAISMMAEVVGVEITTWDCYSPSYTRWAKLILSINRFLRFRTQFRSLESLKTHLDQLPKDMRNIKLEEVQHEFAQVNSDFKREKQRIDQDEMRVLAEQRSRISELGVSDAVHSTSFLDAIDALKQAKERIEHDNNKLKHRTELKTIEKAQMVAEIGSMKESIPELEKKLELLRKLRSNTTISTMENFNSTKSEVENLQSKVDGILTEITSITDLLTVLNEGLNAIASAKERWEKCKSNIEVPNSEVLNEQIKSLRKVVNDLTEEQNDLTTQLVNLKNLVKSDKVRLVRTEANTESIRTSRSNKKQTTTELSKLVKKLKEELNDDKQAIKVAEAWIEHFEYAQDAHKKLLAKRDEVIRWLEFMLSRKINRQVIPGIPEDVREAFEAAETSVVADVSLDESNIEIQLKENSHRANEEYPDREHNYLGEPTDDNADNMEVDSAPEQVDIVGFERRSPQRSSGINEQSFLNMDSYLQPDAPALRTPVKKTTSKSPSISPNSSPGQSPLHNIPKRRGADSLTFSPMPSGVKKVKFASSPQHETSPRKTPIKQRIDRSNEVANQATNQATKPSAHLRDQSGSNVYTQPFSAFGPEESDNE